MTHDELLARLTPSLTYSPSLTFGAIPILYSLRAVVELHTPDWRNQCSHCLEPNDHDELNKNYLYPCPTIQAIEDVLE